MTNGYNFYFKIGEDVLTFPITPPELTIKVGSNNKTVTLINEGDVNILKSPSLIEVEFEARFPMRQYPYAREFQEFQTYYDKFKDIKENKKSFRFIVARTNPNGSCTWDTNLLMALEDFELKESVDEGDDVLVSFRLKQFKDYGVKTIKIQTNPSSTSTSDSSRGTDEKENSSQQYTVKSGDCLWTIAKKFYGSGAKWKQIYDANVTIIEETAKKRGKKSSSNGHWIFPGTILTIPSVSANTSSSSKSSSGSKSSSSSKSSSGSKKYQCVAWFAGNSTYAGTVYIDVFSGYSKTGSRLNYKRHTFSPHKENAVVQVPSGYYVRITAKAKKGHHLRVNSPSTGLVQTGVSPARYDKRVGAEMLEYTNRKVTGKVNLIIYWLK